VEGQRKVAEYTPEFRNLDVAGTKIRIASAGSGEPLLMINGIGASIEMWEPLAARLSTGRTLLMFDAPGTGGSAPLRRPLRMRGVARLVLRLLDQLGHSQVDVLGYSWGGALAQELAHVGPERVRRLVLAATTPGVGAQPPSPLVLAMMSSPLRYSSPGYLSRVAPFIYGGGARRTGLPALTRAWGMRPPSLRSYAAQVFAIATWSSLPWLSRVAAPTLILQGDDDPLVPARDARMMAKRLPNAQLRVIPGAGHLWLLESAPAAAEMIEKFLR